MDFLTFVTVKNLLVKGGNKLTVINLWEHNSWGNNVYFFDYDERKLVGWLTPLPKVGDEVRSKMQSRKIARFEIISIDVKKDPPDMFFAIVKDIGYLEDTEN